MKASPLIACHQCGALHERAPIAAGERACCAQCGTLLYQKSRMSVDGSLALVVTALITFVIANAFPIVRLTIQGKSVDASLPGALWFTWWQQHEVVAAMAGLFAFWLPLTQLLFLFWALMCLRSGRLPWDFPQGLRMLNAVMPWSMVPVLMLAILVALVKFSSMATLVTGPGIWAFLVLAFLLTAIGRYSAQALWRDAEDAGLTGRAGLELKVDLQGVIASCHGCGLVQNMSVAQSECERCHNALHRRKPDQQSRVWALLIAAIVLYVPANLLPIMQVRTPAGESAHTIIGGVQELWVLGSWDLALIVFIASVVVPLIKLVSLVVLMTAKAWRGAAVQRQRTRLYELLEFIGQWSMLDVFVVVLLGAMANFPGLAQITVGPGAASFGLVVIFTMLAAMSYDPRVGWDCAEPEEQQALQSARSTGS
jgi:paraquat-inducible protein A